MKLGKLKRSIFVTSSCFYTGCIALNPSAPFDFLEATLKERTNHTVIWNQQTPEDTEVQGLIKTLLQGTLTVESAVEVSLLNNPTLQAQYAELGVAQAELVQAGLLSNPTFSFERRFSGRAVEADIAQEFLSLFLIPLRTKAAEAELQAATNRVTQSVLDHVMAVKSAFYSLQGEQQSVEMRESIVKALEASYRTAQALREAGNTSLLATQDEANLLAESKVALAEAQLRILENREHLQVLLGAWGDNTRWKINRRLPDLLTEEVSLSGLESHAIRHRLDLAATRNELDSVATQVGIARYQALIPTFTVGNHFEREPEGESTTGPSIDFSLPIINWGRATSVQGQALFDQYLRRYEAMAIEIRSKVRLAYGRMKAARTRAEYYHKEVLPLQQRTIEQTQLFYNGMFFSVFQLLQAKQAQITAGQAYIETLKDYWLARTELEQVLGGSITGLATTQGKTVSPMAPNAALRKPAVSAHQHY